MKTILILELRRSLSVLRAAIEATADGLLVTDKLGKVLCYNQLYVDMWPIPNELLAHARHQAILEYCARQLRDPLQFLRSTEKIYATLAPESFDVFEFRDGRIFERCAKAKILEGSNTVLVWSFRDITERRQAETNKAQLAAIVESSNDAIIVKARRSYRVSKIARDITERKESQARIEYLAHYDPLTGLANRALLADKMKTVIENASRYSF